MVTQLLPVPDVGIGKGPFPSPAWILGTLDELDRLGLAVATNPADLVVLLVSATGSTILDPITEDNPNQVGYFYGAEPSISADSLDATACTYYALLRYPPPEGTSGPTVGAVFELQGRVGASGGTAKPSKANKNMPCQITAADGDLACAIPITFLPVGWVGVEVNGKGYDPGDATKVAPCYFSGDGGATPRAQGAIQAGDLLYWVGSVAGFELYTGVNAIDFLYDA